MLFYLLKIVYTYFISMCVTEDLSVCTCTGHSGGQEKMLYPLKLTLKMVLSHYMDANNEQ